MPTPFKAVLIDIDGTMLDSNDAHTKAWCDGAIAIDDDPQALLQDLDAAHSRWPRSKH